MFVCMQWQIELPGTPQACIAPGSIIISDAWASYQGMETMTGIKYAHQTVNHTENWSSHRFFLVRLQEADQASMQHTTIFSGQLLVSSFGGKGTEIWTF